MPTPLNEETLSFFEKIQKETTAVEPVNSGLITKPDKEDRSEEHTSELQSRLHLVCRLLLEKKKKRRQRKKKKNKHL